MKVNEFMTKEVASLLPHQTVLDAANLMLDRNISIIPIVDEERNLLGIITESDFIGKKTNIPHAMVTVRHLLGQVFYSGDIESIFSKYKTVPIDKVMSKNPRTVNADDSLSDTVEFMIRFDLDRIPVVQNGKLAGIVTRHDIVRAFKLLANQENTPESFQSLSN